VRRRAALALAALVSIAILWFVTGWIQRQWGLDSVAALFVNFGLFIAVGWALGAAAARRE